MFRSLRGATRALPSTRQEPFCKKVLGTPKTLLNWCGLPTARRQTPTSNQNNAITSLVQAWLGNGIIFCPTSSVAVGRSDFHKPVQRVPQTVINAKDEGLYQSCRDRRPRLSMAIDFRNKKLPQRLVLIRKLNPPKFSYSFRWVYNLYV